MYYSLTKHQKSNLKSQIISKIQIYNVRNSQPKIVQNSFGH